MTPYQALRSAVQRHNGIATAFEVRRELTAYIASLRRPHEPLVIYTREEYFALVNRRKKRKPKGKTRNSLGELVMEYESLGAGMISTGVTGAPKCLITDDDHQEDLDWITQFAQRQQEECDADSYAGEW